MKKVFLLLVAVVFVLSGCSDPKTDAVDQLRDLYEDMSSNSEYYTADEWEAVLMLYAQNDSIINSYEFTVEELQEINDLRGRCAAYLLKGAARGVGKEIDKAINGFGSFMNGLMDEMNKDIDN